jgi:hypothetical protein
MYELVESERALADGARARWQDVYAERIIARYTAWWLHRLMERSLTRCVRSSMPQTQAPRASTAPFGGGSALRRQGARVGNAAPHPRFELTLCSQTLGIDS